MKENKFAAAVAKVLRSQGALVYPLVASSFAPKGWPDKLVIHRKWSGLIEVKAKETRLRPEQPHVLREIRARWCGHVYVVRECDNAQCADVSVIDDGLSEVLTGWEVAFVSLLDHFANNLGK